MPESTQPVAGSRRRSLTLVVAVGALVCAALVGGVVLGQAIENSRHSSERLTGAAAQAQEREAEWDVAAERVRAEYHEVRNEFRMAEPHGRDWRTISDEELEGLESLRIPLMERTGALVDQIRWEDAPLSRQRSARELQQAFRSLEDWRNLTLLAFHMDPDGEWGTPEETRRAGFEALARADDQFWSSLALLPAAAANSPVATD